MSDASYLISGFREMVQSDVQGGSMRYANADYDCTVGTFEKREILINGGFTTKVMGDIQICLNDLPPDTEFKTGQNITVTPKSGPVRECQVDSTRYAGPIITVSLWDVNEGA